MDRDDRIRGIVLAAEHLLGFGGVDFGLERVERAFEIGADVLAGLRPFEQHAEIVDLLREVVAQLEILREPPLTL
jgi:hypothetical protein